MTHRLWKAGGSCKTYWVLFPAGLHGYLHGSMKRNLQVAIFPLSLPMSPRAPQPNPNLPSP